MTTKTDPKNEPTKGEATAEKLPAKHKVERERQQFRALIIGNPNYFGNLKVSPFQPVLNIQSNTTYEEIGCVGFQPQFNRLEAVVYIKQELGYGGDVCSNGTPEYVRFYLSFDNGATWQDQGMASFTAYDIPGQKPLEYDVTLQIDPAQKFCFTENLPKVRAILSWNNPPPPNTPDFTPVYGNVEEAYIQIDPFKLIIVGDLFKAAQVKLPQNFEAVLDLTQPLAAAKPKVLNLTELQALYKDRGVPEHRFLFAEVQKLMAQPGLTESLMIPGFTGLLPELGVDFADLIGTLLQTDGDTRYEELKCVGLNPDLDTLVGVLTVKLPNGYSGDLCSAGSQEYVAFWVDWGDGAGWTYVGTTSVNVHDISSIPPEGLQYSVFLPVDLTCRHQPCQKGAKTAKVRAILSWEVPPPPANPNYVPTWGNREETLIHIKPGPICDPDDHTPYMDTVGNVAVCDINQATGLATGSGIIAAFTANESPFGGSVTITGFILNPPNVMAGAAPFKYKVSVRELPGGSWQPLSNDFKITVTEQFGAGSPVQYNDTQSIDPADGYYIYREQLYPNAWRLVAGRVLAKWVTGAPMIGLWEIKLEAKLPDGTILPVGVISCPDGSTRSAVKVRLDEVAPTANIQITGFSRGGGPVQPAVECSTFQVDDVIYGTYVVSDQHFNRLTLTVEPTGPASGATISPPSKAYPIVPTTGEMGTWSLDTSGMQPCGYIVRLWVEDRTIVNSGFIGWENHDSIGFCLETAPEEPEG